MKISEDWSSEVVEMFLTKHMITLLNVCAKIQLKKEDVETTAKKISAIANNLTPIEMILTAGFLTEMGTSLLPHNQEMNDFAKERNIPTYEEWRKLTDNGNHPLPGDN